MFTWELTYQRARIEQKIQLQENQIEKESSAKEELELIGIINREALKKALSIETAKDNDKLLRFYTAWSWELWGVFNGSWLSGKGDSSSLGLPKQRKFRGN